MARGSQELEQEFIASAKDKTGHSVPEWMGILDKTGLSKTKELVDHLKSAHKLNHMQATFITGIYLNDGQPVYDYAVLFRKLFEGNEAQKPSYDALVKLIENNLSDVECIPTKTYISIEGKKIFACARINKTNMRIGLDLGDRPFDDYVQRAKGLGAMPNLTHMIEVTAAEQVNGDVLTHLQAAYDRTHGG